MRPTKLTPDLLVAFRSVIADEWAALAFTEEELVWQANQRLPETDRITYRTYQRYKAVFEECHTERSRSTQDTRNETQDTRCQTQDTRHKKCHTEPCRSTPDLLHDNEEEIEVEAENAALMQAMHDTLKGALLAQKKALVRGVCEGQPNWRRYTWLLERKFPDFRLKTLTEALAKQPKQNEESLEENKERKEAAAAEEAKKRREAHDAMMAAAKAEKEELMKDPAYKWSHRGYNPFTPAPGPGGYYTMYPEQLKELEEEMARDVAAGYEHPYAHLGYRPDPVERTDGVYLMMGMGPERLPLMAHVYRVADAPNIEEREEQWLAQEQKRRNIIRAEQGLPPENLPEPPDDAPSEHYARGRGINYGHSGMGG
ncbi:hypothetical protein BH09PAT2_BH09PAT2_08540 [soil metagenome]